MFARWRKCDFQVHSCRDPNWTGMRPAGVGDALPNGHLATIAGVNQQREAWADKFIDVCVAKGLGAVALTDHNEVVMATYVRARLKQRIQDGEDIDLWFFPGMELTARSGVQALILFDHDLEDDWIKQAQAKLGIPHPDVDPMKARSPKVTQTTCDYHEIGDALDEFEKLRGRYIVLPNVSGNGSKHSVLYDGGHAYFRQMPYVGAYLDVGQTLETLSHTNRIRLSGTAPLWSNRYIYPIPTSDCRTDDFLKLGSNDTWIKLAEPTAEAIRQAFLAPQSRIRLSQPNPPSLYLRELHLKQAMTLQDASVALSPELNSIIGGRGTGKSTLLEYLGFALGRSFYDMNREDYSGGSRLEDLIKDTIIAKSATVRAEIVQDGAQFIIERGPASTYGPLVHYPNGEKQLVKVEALRDLFPAIIYAQGELAELGKKASEHTELTDLLQFVSPEYKRENDKLSLAIEAAKISVRSAVERQIDHWMLQSELRKHVTERDAKKVRLSALEKSLPALSPDDQAILARFEQSAAFEEKRRAASEHAETVISELESANTDLLKKRDFPADIGPEAALFEQAYDSFFSELSSGLSTLRKQLAAKHAIVRSAEAAWVKVATSARKERDRVLAKLSEHKTTTTQITKLRDELGEANRQIGELELKIAKLADVADEVSKSLAALRSAASDQEKRTSSWAEEIESLSNKRIRATVQRCAETGEIREAIDDIATKTGSQTATREDGLRNALAKDGAWVTLDKLRADCLALAHWRFLGGAINEEQPKLSDLLAILGTTAKIKTTLFAELNKQKIASLAAAIPLPLITLRYCDEGVEIAFEKASEGQRAAALLFMLLEQPGGPLIIDQPEGDLDNSIIADLAEKLHVAKDKRQIIFASHNANIVVNGSSELVIGLSVSAEGKRSISTAGAIDTDAVRQVITRTMEGGEKAFRDRLDKYGF
jgi:type III restriction enzyme